MALPATTLAPFLSRVAALIFLCVAPLKALQAQTQIPWTQDERNADLTKPVHEWPAGVLMPWRTLAIDEGRTVLARANLRRAWASLSQAFFASAQPASASFANEPSLTINRKRRLDQMAAGKPKNPAESPLVVEPVWCSVLDHDVFFVTVSDTKLNRLLGSAHFAVRRPEDPKDLRDKAQQLVEAVTAQMPRLLQDALAAANGRPAKGDALQVGLSLGRNVTRQDEGDSGCMALLLEESLAKEYTVTRSFGADQLASLRDALQQPAQLDRPTRTLVMRWHLDPEEAPQRKLPAELRLDATFGDAVFGQPLPGTHHGKTALRADGTRIALGIDPSFKKFLDGEKASLLASDMPQVAKVYGAWVYLDRGRAWGLRMRDRMVADVDGELVKGHVVRFFGPEMGLTSPRGFPIREGAILYIRKGQKKTKPGQQFRFDERTYPAPWPPPSQAKGASPKKI